MTRGRHNKLSRLVDSWIDGELPRELDIAVGAHVAGCWDCSATAETTRLVSRALHAGAGHEPPAIASARLHRFAASLTS